MRHTASGCIDILVCEFHGIFVQKARPQGPGSSVPGIFPAV
jgi:hypothetical protein